MCLKVYKIWDTVVTAEMGSHHVAIIVQFILYLDAVLNLAFALSLLCFIIMHASLLLTNTTSVETLLSELSNEVGFPVTNTSFDALLESLLSTAKPFPQSAGYRILAS
ncbi:hypothetical protein Tco_0164385 [Tanacetum coccineum]